MVNSYGITSSSHQPTICSEASASRIAPLVALPGTGYKTDTAGPAELELDKGSSTAGVESGADFGHKASADNRSFCREVSYKHFGRAMSLQTLKVVVEFCLQPEGSS